MVVAVEHFGYKEIGFKFASPTRVIMPMEIDMFCEISGMREEIFLRDEVGRSYGAKGRVVPGVFLMAITLGFLYETGLSKATGAFYLGTDKFKVNSPVYPFDTVSVEIEVIKKRVTSKGDRVVLTYAWFMKNQEGVVVAEAENTCIFPNPKAA